MAVDLYSILAPGHDRSSIADLNDAFRASLDALISGAPPQIAAQIGINSGYRSPDYQKTLFERAVAKYGSPEAARKWVAPPGRSRHNFGDAVDLSFGSDAARQWVHDHAAEYNLQFPMSWEPWHIEPAGSRNAPLPTAAASTAAPAAPATPAGPVSPTGNAAAAILPTIKSENPSLGALFADAFANRQQPVVAEPQTVRQDDAPALMANAQNMAQKSKRLNSAFLPNVSAILGLGKA